MHNLGFTCFFDPEVLVDRISEAGFIVLKPFYSGKEENEKDTTGHIP